MEDEWREVQSVENITGGRALSGDGGERRERGAHRAEEEHDGSVIQEILGRWVDTEDVMVGLPKREVKDLR